MNLIFTSFYYNPGANKAHGVKLDTYLKLICVSLISAKKANPDDEVSLIVPESTKQLINEYYVDILEQNGVSIQQIEFDCFANKDNNAIWNFSLYALCCLKHLTADNNYQNLCFIDSDTFSVKAFEDIWVDCANWIMLCDINHSHSIRQAINTFNDYKRYSGKELYITNWGGSLLLALQAS